MAVEVNPQYQTDSILISTDATANADDSKLYAAQSLASSIASAESASESEASSVVSLESMNTSISQASIATTKASEANTSANNASTYASNALTSANNSASSSSSSSTYATNSYNSSVASASSASSASTSASNASTSATTATTKAGEASTSASNALSYKNTTSGYMTTTEGYKNTTSGYMTTTSGYMTTTEGYKNAASTSSSNASTSEANALTYKNTATTQAGIATTQASNALTSANNADTSEANALTYSNNALASANAADVSEANALTYAGNALTSANNAASSLATFNGKYVSSATAPSSPTEGMLWYDTVNNIMKVYRDSGWAEVANIYTKAELAGAIGNINSPLLDMPLNNSLAMKAGVGSATFTRATTATYIDRYGILQNAAIDEPRFEKEGYLNEGASTNYLFPSNGSTNTDLGFTRTTTIGIDGIANSAFRFTEDTSNVQRRFRDTSENPLILSEGAVLTHSAFVKPSGSRTNIALLLGTDIADSTIVEYRLSDKTIGVSTSSIGTISNQKIEQFNDWYRLSYTITLSTAITTVGAWLFFSNVYGDGNATYTGDGSSYIDYFGAQIETLPFATSYIPTVASAVTRSADYLSVTRANNFPDAQSNVDGFSIAFYYDIKGLLAGNQYLWALRVASTDVVCGYITNIGAIRNICVNAYGTIGNSISITEYLSNRLVQIQSNTLMTEYADGIIIDSDSNPSGTLGITTNTLSILYIGTSVVGSPMYGHISNFRIYDKALTATEVALV